MRKPLKVYFISLGAVLLASVYPIYMGGVMLQAYILNGGIDVANYPKYIIPYTPICIALIICVTLLPFTFKFCKRFMLPIISIFAILLFLGTEMIFEKVTVFSETIELMEVKNEAGEQTTELATEWSPDTVETWQWLSCSSIVPPPLLEQEPATELMPATVLLKNPLITEYSPVFKMHFYMISIIIILAVLGVIYGFYKMTYKQNYKKKKPLIVQLASVLIFIGLCILACFTAFFRTGTIIISPLSAVLMTAFFLVFGITAGVYAGTWLYGKRKLFSFIIPSIVAAIVTIAMYIGEMVMMNWNLYRFGKGIMFDPIGTCPLAPVDILVIAMSGAITYFILFLIRQQMSQLEANN